MQIDPIVDQIAVTRHARLVDLLACPLCAGSLTRARDTVRSGAVVDADLYCADCGQVGAIRSYKPTFHTGELGDGWLPGGFAEAPVDLAGVTRFGDWSPQPVGLLGSGIGACLTGETTAAGIACSLGTHDWGAAGLVSCGAVEERRELYSADPGSARVVVHRPDELGTVRRWSCLIGAGVATAEHRERSQALVRRIAELVPADQAPPLQFVPSNRGNPYPPRLDALLAEAPPDAVVLDLGGGDRCHPDPRVLNFEYMRFDNADFFGDGLHLPVASDSVDLIMSQAVLEHVPDPAAAVAEMRRVLRPGGRVYAEFAFMQPLHAVPYHFFNITPHGSALLFEAWDVVDTGVFGGLATTLRWMFDLLGADDKLGRERTSAVLDALGDLDRQLSARELEHVASAVYVEARKPLG